MQMVILQVILTIARNGIFMLKRRYYGPKGIFRTMGNIQISVSYNLIYFAGINDIKILETMGMETMRVKLQ